MATRKWLRSKKHSLTPKAVSTCIPVTQPGMLELNIHGYRLHKGMGHEKFISSGAVSVGGHNWEIRFYPDGYSVDDEATVQRYISVYLVLLSKGAQVRASCDISLIDHRTGKPSTAHKTQPRMFKYGDLSMFYPQTAMFIDCNELQASAYLLDDCLTIQCCVTVISEPVVPPSDLPKQLGRLLEDRQGMDVTFVVQGETFKAHRMVLAMRSPVFKAELCGQMREARMQCLTIEDMQPVVFRDLLYFIYNDSLPDMDGYLDNAGTEMIRHLLVAADRYAMERMKFICQSILANNLSVDNVATTLGLADMYDCGRLKKFCRDFMNSSSRMMAAVAATPGYKNLKRVQPSVLAEEYEKKPWKKEDELHTSIFKHTAIVLISKCQRAHHIVHCKGVAEDTLADNIQPLHPIAIRCHK
ncbi:hypothetical protein EJB05_09114, partial [Eragrostis curvula]